MDWWVFFVLNYKGLKMVKSLTSIAGLACVEVVVVTDSLHLYWSLYLTAIFGGHPFVFFSLLDRFFWDSFSQIW
jgi:hypothetical protein